MWCIEIVVQERILGGVLELDKRYQVYFTESRVIVVKTSMLAFTTLNMLAEACKGVLRENYLEKSFPPDARMKIFENIEKKKKFEAYRDQVSIIELRKPHMGLIRSKKGYIRIVRIDGKEIKIGFMREDLFDEFAALIYRFKPEALRIVS